MSLQFKPTTREHLPAVQLVVWKYSPDAKRTLPRAVRGGCVVLGGVLLKEHPKPPADLLERVRDAGGADDEISALTAWWTEQHAVLARAQHAQAIWWIQSAARDAVAAVEAGFDDAAELEKALAALELTRKALKKALRASQKREKAS